MMKLIKAENGMDILGQGGKIILFTLPSLAAAIWLARSLPAVAALPAALGPVRPLGYALLIFGAVLWAAGLVQLLAVFPRGRLATRGAYGVCRNPIYSSFIVFVLPALSLLTLTWVYFGVAAFLYVGVRIFIGKEERQLLQVFGDEYAGYLGRVSRILPFARPSRKVKNP
jgi:protein-S-isoprenylcysteine O-methyltransferase Ste14